MALQREKRTVNYPLLLVTCIVAPAILAGGYFLRQSQMPHIASQFLSLADAEEEKAEAASEPADKAVAFRQAANFVFRYIEIVGRDIAQELRMLDLWEAYADLLPPASRQYAAAKSRSLDLHFRVLGGVKASEELQSHIAPLRVRLMELADEQARRVVQKEQAEQLLAQDLTSEKEEGDTSQQAVGKAVAKMLDGKSAPVLVRMAGENPELPLALEHLARAMWSMVRADSISAEDKEYIFDVIRLNAEAQPDSIEATLQYVLLVREHPKMLPQQFKKTHPTRESQLEFADSLLDRFVESHRTAENLLARSQYRAQYNVPGADEDVEMALTIQDGSASVQQFAARTFYTEALRLSEDDPKREFLFARAADTYEKLQESHPELAEAFWGQADGLLRIKDFQEAAEACQRGLEQHPHNRELLSRLVRLHVAQGEYDAAEEILARIDEQTTEDWKAPLTAHERLNTAVQIVRAAYLLGKNEPRKAIQLLAPITSNTESPNERLDALRLSGQAYEQLSLWDQAAVFYEKALAEAPTDTLLRIKAGNCRSRANQFGEAAEHFARVVDKTKTPDALEAYANVLLQIQATSSAPSRSWSRFDRAVEDFEAALQEDTQAGEPWRADMMRVQKSYVNDDYAAAKKSLEDMLLDHGDSPACRREIASMYISLDELDKARETLDFQQVRTEDSFADAALRSRLLKHAGDHKAAVDLLKEQIADAEPEDQTALRLGIAQVYVAAKDQANAIAQLDQIQNVGVNQLDDIVYLVDTLLASQSAASIDNARAWAERISKIAGADPSLVSFLHCRVLLAEANQSPTTRLKNLEQVRAELQNFSHRPNWPGYHLVRSLLAEAEGNRRVAIKFGEAAIEAGDHRTWMVARLVQMYQQMRDKDKARELLTRLSKVQKLSGALTSLAIQLAPDLNDAERIAREGAEQRPDDPAAHLWLGMILSAKQIDDDEAYEHLKRAVELSPKNRQAWNSLFSHLVRVKQMDEARETLKGMVDATAKSEAHRFYMLGQGYEFTDPERAKPTYEKALSLRAAEDKQDVALTAGLATYFIRSGNADIAKGLYEEVLAIGRRTDNKELMSVSHRALASIAATGGAEDWLAQTKKHLNAATDVSGPESAESNAQLEAALFIQRGDFEEGCRGQVILEDLVAQPQHAPGSAFLLSQLYLMQSSQAKDKKVAAEKQNAARELLDGICEISDNPNFRLRLASLLMRMRRYEEADRHLKRLEGNPPYDSRVALGRAKLLQVEGAEPHQIVDTVAKFVEGHGEGLSGNYERDINTAAGRILTGFGLHEEAEKYCKRAFELDPDYFLPVVANYAHRGLVDEAIALCRTRTASKAHALIALTAVLSSGQASPEQLEGVRTMVEDALSEKGDSRQVRVAAGVYYMAVGEMKTAVAHYEQVLTESATDLIALNNLAMIRSEDQSQLDTAMKHVQTAIEEHGNIPALLDTQAMIHLRNKRYESAVENLQLATNLELYPNPVHQFHLAVSLARLGKFSEARSLYEDAKEQGLKHKLWTETERELQADLERRLQKEEQ